MAIQVVIKKTWLSQKPNPRSYLVSSFFLLIVIVGYLIYQSDFINADLWMSANPKQVFSDKEYWRVWTTLFAHADFAHLSSNLLLFVPFCYYLMGYFSFFFFPFLGILFGGLINFLVLAGMSEQNSIIGISGVVSWMGAAWLTLYFFIQRVESFRHRIAKVIIISVVLFLPEKFDPQVSYLSHALGYLFGVICGTLYYFLNRTHFLSREEVEFVDEELPILENENSI